MRKTVFAVWVILIFCLNSLAQEKIATLGTDPIYRNVPDAETVRQIIKDKENVVRTALNDDSLCRILYDQIDEVEIGEEQIEKGQKIIWMIFGREPNKTKIKRNLEWVGKPFDAFVFLILTEDYKYRYEYKFIVPRPCGNISLTEIHRSQIELPEPVPFIEKKEEIRTYPSRIRVEPKKNFRIRALYPLEPKLSLDLPSEFEGSARFEDYWDWACYSWIGDDQGYMWTYSEAGYQSGDILYLSEMREVSQTQTGFPFGLGAELRIVGNFWLGGSYSQSPKQNIKTTEKEEFIQLEEFKEIEKGQGYFLYQLKLDRFSLVQEIVEKFYSQNFQLYLKHEFKVYRITNLFAGVGIDWLKTTREVEKKLKVDELMPWTGKLALEQSKTYEQKQSKWFTRPFVLAGMIMDVIDGVGVGAHVGAQGKYFFLTKEVKFDKDFLLQVESPTWIIKPSPWSVEIFVAFSF